MQFYERRLLYTKMGETLPDTFLVIVIKTTFSFRLNSQLRFFRRELLREPFSPHNHKKWVHNPLLNFSVHTIVGQIAGLNAPI